MVRRRQNTILLAISPLRNVPSTDRGLVELCVRRISWDPIGFRVHMYGYMSESSSLGFVLFVIVAALVCWTFGVLA